MEAIKFIEKRLQAKTCFYNLIMIDSDAFATAGKELMRLIEENFKELPYICVMAETVK